MESLGVITKIEQATEWCAGMVVVPKNRAQFVFVLIFGPEMEVF